VPAVLGAYFRAKLPETPRYTAQIKGDYKQAAKDITTVMNDYVTVKRVNVEDTDPKDEYLFFFFF